MDASESLFSTGVELITRILTLGLLSVRLCASESTCDGGWNTTERWPIFYVERVRYVGQRTLHGERPQQLQESSHCSSSSHHLHSRRLSPLLLQQHANAEAVRVQGGPDTALSIHQGMYITRVHTHTHMGLDHKRCAHCCWLSGAMARCDERNAVWWMPLSITTDHSACEPECMHTCCGASCEVMGVQWHVNSTANDCMCFHNEACAVVVVVTCCAVVVEVEVRRGRVAPAT